MDSLTHFHFRNVYFYIHYCNSLKVTALDMFQQNSGSHHFNWSLSSWVYKKCQKEAKQEVRQVKRDFERKLNQNIKRGFKELLCLREIQIEDKLDL